MTAYSGRVTCDLSISADGYSAGLDQSEQRPFGEDGGDGWGDRLHSWMFATPELRQAELDRLETVGAFIMGRNMFGPVRGTWDRDWKG
ncbi:Dihydrofolate reductase (EC [Streptomyces globisporus]|uniref:Dihydrofolate reductase (EC) n=2 Tax=Streptomyces globisporus TaxID=1908 RepID=A0ABM9H3J2_STRGL|nr:Dihydrofolate reductase (EC [Streptomyces globisporus]